MVNNYNRNQNFPASASQFEKLIKGILGKSYDIIIEKFETEKGEAVVVFVDGFISKDLVDRDIIKPLKDICYDGNLKKSINSIIEKATDMQMVVSRILEGNVAVFDDNSEYVYTVEFKQWDRRGVTEPDAETVTRGPKEGFTESIVTNTIMLRRKLKTSNLTLEKMILGRQSNTLIAIAYLEDIVNQEVLKEVKKRLNKIDIDAILETGQIEQLIEEKPFALLNGIGLTQKPDKAAAKLLEGRVAILCDGTPHALIIPELFIENLHSSEDYYSRTVYTNFMRLIRLFGLIISILMPGLSVAILTFNQEMVPFTFLESYISATMKTPFPEAVEVFFLIVMFELLKEASTRFPKSIGSAITIVGALIIGEAAVNAGIVGAPSVIIVALTSVAGLLNTNLDEFSTVYRFFFLFLGASMGLIGISAGMVIMLTQIISTDSFGIPILSSFGKEERKDNLLKSSIKDMIFRPRSIVKNNVKRMKPLNEGK